MLTIIAYHPSGFEIRITQDAFDKLDQSVNYLLKNNFRPQLGYQYTPEGSPICPRHNVPMVKREKQGDVWYSHNTGSEDSPLWCRGYEHKNSPGFGSSASNGLVDDGPTSPDSDEPLHPAEAVDPLFT